MSTRKSFLGGNEVDYLELDLFNYCADVVKQFKNRPVLEILISKESLGKYENIIENHIGYGSLHANWMNFVVKCLQELEKGADLNLLDIASLLREKSKEYAKDFSAALARFQEDKRKVKTKLKV